MKGARVEPDPKTLETTLNVPVINKGGLEDVFLFELK
jgi:hypothetical protein